MIIYLREKERDYGGGRRAEEDGERETQDSTLSLGSNMGLSLTTLRESGARLNLMTQRSWPKPKPRVGCLIDWAIHAPHQIKKF